MTKATLQNLTRSPHDVMTVTGPAILPAAIPGDDKSGFLTADFPDDFLTECDAVPYFTVHRDAMKSEAPKADAAPAAPAALPGLPGLAAAPAALPGLPGLPAAPAALPGLPGLPAAPAVTGEAKAKRGRPKTKAAQ